MAKPRTITSPRSRSLKYVMLLLRNRKADRRMRLGIEDKMQEFFEGGNRISFEGAKVCVKPYPLIKNTCVDIYPEPGTRITGLEIVNSHFTSPSPTGVEITTKSSNTVYRIYYEPKKD